MCAREEEFGSEGQLVLVFAYQLKFAEFIPFESLDRNGCRAVLGFHAEHISKIVRRPGIKAEAPTFA